MCNVVMQRGRKVRPGERLSVEMELDGSPAEGVFAGTARSESRGWWMREKGARDVRIPAVEGFEERDERNGQQNEAALPDGAELVGLLLPEQIGKDGTPYRLLKVMSRQATPEEYERFGNDRVPVVR